jgi:hypothetical protein
MATNRSGHRPGGGIASRVNVSPSVRTGTGSRATNPGYVGQLGNKQGSHVTRGDESGYRGEIMHRGPSFQPVKFGNEVALNVGKGGCGTGRTLYGQAGSQGTHGPTNPGNPPKQVRDTLSEFGPDYRRPRNNPHRSSDSDADF